MAFFSLDQIADLGTELNELYVDNEVIHTITTDLADTADEVEDTGFTKLHVSQTVFGASTIGDSLGHHHTLAHAKVAGTLASVLADLHSCRLGLQTFQRSVDAADTQSADDLRARHDAVLALRR